MLAALITALFFGLTPVCANRAIRLIGFASANFWRLLLASAALGAWSLTLGQGFEGRFWWFFAAGTVGFGLGGMSMFLALPRLGAPLASLMVESLAAVSAMGLAWIWYQDTVAPRILAWAALVLVGVAVGLWPYIRTVKSNGQIPIGAWWALAAGLGQGVSIVISRKALMSMHQAEIIPDLPTAAFHRLLGGLCVALVVLLLVRQTKFAFQKPSSELPGRGESAWMWVGLNSLFGPILGVTSLIWALSSMHPGLVQTIAATAPLISVPFTRWLEGHLPPALYYLGCGLCLTGLAGLYLFL